MIAVRLLYRPQWEAQLRALGCRPAADGESRKIQTAEWWVTPSVKVLTVPIDSAGRVTQFDLDDVIKSVRSMGPGKPTLI